jgi:hypothetical protein
MPRISVHRDGENLGFESLAKHVSAEFAYVLLIERDKVKVGASEDRIPSALGVTMIFRAEEGTWRKECIAWQSP